MEQILSLLPEIYSMQLRKKDLRDLEELRLAAGAPLQARTGDRETFFWPKLQQRQLEEVLRAACRQSVYAYTETLRQGFLTLDHGHRIGFCGCGVVRDGQVVNLHTPSSMLFRVARSVPGCAEQLLPQIIGSALIVGPPGSGKTTLLRDLIRLLSDQRQARIGVVDERGELAACRDGVPQLNVGIRTDVLVNVPKSEGILMLLRTMSLQWIAVDEISSPADAEAMVQAGFCGVRFLATAHGTGLAELRRRPIYEKLLEHHLFSHIVTMKRDKSYTIEEACS